MAIDSYSTLKTTVTDYLTLDATAAAMLPTFIQAAESELSRLILAPQRELIETASTAAGTQTVSLPSNFAQARSLLIDDDYPLEPVTLNTLLASNSDSPAGRPIMYCIAGQSLYLSPIPDAVYTLTLFCLSAIPALSDANPTNWLLLAHPDAYLFATIMQAEIYMVNDERADRALSRLAPIVEQINRQGNRYRNASPMRLRSPVVV